MKTFKLTFEGRKLNAIGKLYKFNESIQAIDIDNAILALYYNYEHIRILTVNGKKFDYNSTL